MAFIPGTRIPTSSKPSSSISSSSSSFIPGTIIPTSNQSTIPGTNIPTNTGRVSSSGTSTYVSGGSSSSGGSSYIPGTNIPSGSQPTIPGTLIPVTPKEEPKKPVGGRIDIGSGQSSSAFRPSGQDSGIQLVDNLSSSQISQTNILGLDTGRKLNIVQSSTGKTYAPIPGTNIGVEVDVNKWKGYFDEINVANVRKTPTAIDLTTGKQVSSDRAKQAIEANISGEALRESEGYKVPAFFLGAGAAGALGQGTGFLGKLVTGLTKSSAITSVSVPVARGVVDVLEPSGLDYEDRIKFAQEVDRRIGEKVTQQGLSLPFVGREVEQFTGGLVGDIVYNLPGGRIGETISAQKEYVNVLREAGYSPSEARRLAGIEARREFLAGGTGEIVGFGAGAQAVGEISGAATQKAFNIATKAGLKTFTPTTATVFGAVSGAIGGGVGGVAEGAIIYPFFQEARRREITPEGWAQSVVFSGATAAIGGGVIGGLITRKTTQKAAYGVGAILEGGQEYLGDVAAKKLVGDVFESGIKIRGVGAVKTPTVTPTFTQNILNIFNPNMTSTDTFTQTGTTTKTSGMTESTTQTIIEPITVTPTITDTLTITKVQTPSPVYVPTITPTETPTPVSSIVETPTETIIDIITDTETPTDTITDTSTITLTQTITPTTTPTYTFTAGFPPLIPFGLDIGGGSGSGRGKRKTKFYDELASAKSIAREFNTGIGFAPMTGFKQPTRRTTKTFKPTNTFTPFKVFQPLKTSSKARRKTKTNDLFDIDNIFSVKKGRRIANAFYV